MNYRFENNKYIIEDYDERKPFASFLPGVAGVDGIPMWAYYTNRGQGIAGFGVENKDGSIMDFVPANMAYRRTELAGFRTFVKVNQEVHEIFSSSSSDAYKREMIIETNSVSFVENNTSIGLKVTAKFFTVTNKNFPGLVRKVTIEKLKDSVEVEIIDGLVTVWPYKNNNFAIKNMSNLAVAWFEAYNVENKMPFFRNRSTTEDSSAVGSVEAGHFYGTHLNYSHDFADVIYDPDLIFGQNTSNIRAKAFQENTLKDILAKKQVSANKLACGFSCFEGTIDQALVMTSIFGKLNHVDQVKDLQKKMNDAYMKDLEEAAIEIGENLTSQAACQTAYPLFDAYVKQSYLDNLLRGGIPLVFEGKEGPIVYHVFSRIHGDMEREYNDFYVEPAYYSHGNGNFRDVNQNRRNDVYFQPQAGLYNVKQFMELLQMDGQNPLTIKGSTLKVAEEDIRSLLEPVSNDQEVLKSFLIKDFTPGALLKFIEDSHINLTLERNDFLKLVMSKSIQENQAAYGHGFWVDHWTYNMDLVDSYLNVYPDHLEELMYHTPLKYFQSPEEVLDRNDKYVITEEGKIRQYDQLFRDEDRIKKLDMDPNASNWMKNEDGTIYHSNLFEKLLVLSVNKVTNFDPSNLGIMMNSDKPGWNDAMNGLPGLFGSGTSEVIEIKRVITWMLKTHISFNQPARITKDLYELIQVYMKSVDFDTLQNAKEYYLKQVRFNVKDLKEISASEIKQLLEVMLVRIEESLKKAFDYGHGILPSYFVHEAVEYDLLDKKHPKNGLQNVWVTKWSARPLPLYLEAPARYLKQSKDPKLAKKLYTQIKSSGMYDEKLKMYVTSESLEDESLEIGRARAFTPGWLEREAVFMHMEYKYLLGLLKGGLYDEYYDAIQTAMPPFMDPEVYGRSVLENSSFIASSRNPNADNHGRGFVSRLTGTTSELISMWLHMMTGSKIFTYDHDLKFELAPKLSKDFFIDQKVSFTLFSHIKVLYHNPQMLDTYQVGVGPIAYKLIGEQTIELKEVTGQYAEKIRQGAYERIEVELGRI